MNELRIAVAEAAHRVANAAAELGIRASHTERQDMAGTARVLVGLADMRDRLDELLRAMPEA